MVVLPGQRTVEPLPAVATGMVHPPNQMVAAMARKNRKMGRRRGRRRRRKSNPDFRQTRWYISFTSSEAVAELGSRSVQPRARNASLAVPFGE